MLRIEKYNRNQNVWDDFVLNQSVNGTFLQTMRFLNYHPKDRFIDDSLMVYDDRKLVAVVPGCILIENEKRVFYSHKGTSYGGIIVDGDYYKSERLIEIVEKLDRYFMENYGKIVLRITPDIFCKKKSDLLQYVLRYNGYSSFEELSTYLDLDKCPVDVAESFDRNKKRNIKKCLDKGLYFKELLDEKQIEGFHRLLTINLKKHEAKPIHSIEELLDLKFRRFNETIRFFGAFKEEEMVAAGMMFDFEHKVFHAQNLSYDYHMKEYSPITFLYYKVIDFAKKNSFKFVSWGISTENHGKVLNLGLIRNKESYGSDYQLNRVFYKEYT